MELELIENSEIDFWNCSAYCYNKELTIPTVWKLLRHGIKTESIAIKSSTEACFDLGLLNNIFTELDDIIKQFRSIRHRHNSDGSGSDMEKNFLLKQCFSIFLKKIEAFTESSAGELTALKVLSEVSSVPDIQPQYLFQFSGLLNWIKEMDNKDSPKIFLETWKIMHNMNNYESGCIFLKGVYPLQPSLPKETPIADIVLVHGIMGGASWTWRQHDSRKTLPVLTQDQRMQMLHKGYNQSEKYSDLVQKSYTYLWPLDWLYMRIKKPVRLIAIDYPALWWKWSDKYHYYLNDHNLKSLSEEFRIKLKEAGVGSRPIIWITHSMGGLIVKQMLQKESDICESSNVAEIEEESKGNLLLSTRGVVFLSVPHFGSPLASWSCRFSPILRPSKFIYDMRADNHDLLMLHQTFLELCQKHSVSVVSINEKKPLQIKSKGPRILFVPSNYGNPCIGEFHEVDATHLEVSKPKDISDEIYQIVEKFIIRITESIE